MYLDYFKNIFFQILSMKDVGNTVVWTLQHGKLTKARKQEHTDCRQNKSPVEKRIQNIISVAILCCVLTSFIFNFFFILSGKYFNQQENLNTILYYAKKNISLNNSLLFIKKKFGMFLKCRNYYFLHCTENFD